jgi:uncharacterized protein (UPF0210 family)
MPLVWIIAIPGDTKAETIAGIIADEAAIGMIIKNNGSSSDSRNWQKSRRHCRVFGGLLDMRQLCRKQIFLRCLLFNRGGSIPAPIHSFNKLNNT